MKGVRYGRIPPKSDGMVLGDEAPQARLQLLVETVSVTIGLRVVARGQTDRGGRSRQNSFQNAKINCGPLSDTVSAGNPWILKIWSIMVSAVSLADGNFSRGMKCEILEKRLTTVKIVVLSLEGGSRVTKSIDMWDHGR